MVELKFMQSRQIHSRYVQRILHEIFMPINLLSSKLIFKHHQHIGIVKLPNQICRYIMLYNTIIEGNMP